MTEPSAEYGKIYICGTPIGNLEDISRRALRTLKEVDLIAAEDTRRTGQLLHYFEIETPMTSYHEHNERERAERLIAEVLEGKNIALVSDAGMPVVSDPGAILINQALDTGIRLIPIPGPTAAISALVISGLRADRFVFEGFLPRKGAEREERLTAVQHEQRTAVIYESPYRLRDTLKELAPLLGERTVVVVRELTKVHEERLAGTCQELLAGLKDREIKGEIVLLIEGRQKPEPVTEGWEELTILEHLQLMMEQGISKKKAISGVARVRGLPKRKVYKEAVVINVDKDSKV